MGNNSGTGVDPSSNDHFYSFMLTLQYLRLFKKFPGKSVASCSKFLFTDQLTATRNLRNSVVRYSHTSYNFLVSRTQYF